MPDSIIPPTDPAAQRPAGMGTQAARTPVVLLPGDGIGPEVTAATRRICDAAGAAIDWRVAEAGAACFAKGIATGVPRATLDLVAEAGVVLKAPLETAVGYGGKSVNVTLRNLFEMYGNLRPVKELPGVKTPFSGRGIDMLIVRENIEDLYAGIEHMQTPNVAQSLKLMSVQGCDRILRLAFTLAQAEGRKRVTCVTKANIMKLTEGMMKRRFEAMAPQYPGIAADHLIVDNCAHQMVIRPERLDVIVTSNLFGDILSDLAAGLVGGLGVAPSANVGARVAMFEAVHGSAPDIAGKGLANPTALLLAACMMLRHIGQGAIAQRVEKALFRTLEAGTALTADLARAHPPVSTGAFTDAVIAALELAPPAQAPVAAAKLATPAVPAATIVPEKREVIGVDVFVESRGPVRQLAEAVEQTIGDTPFVLKMISNRGAQAWPATVELEDMVDHWRCRFVMKKPGAWATEGHILALLQRVSLVTSWIHIEKLQRFDGEDGFSKAQGEA